MEKAFCTKAKVWNKLLWANVRNKKKTSKLLAKCEGFG